jgi:hypothetical protein
MNALHRLAAGLMLLGAAAVPAWAQAPTTSAGPGRIVCTSSGSCQLGIGTPAKMHYRIDISALSDADRGRLVKDCTAKSKPCVATVEGNEGKDPMQVKGTKITWYN